MKILFVKGLYDFCYYVRGYLPAVYGKQMAMPLTSEADPLRLSEQANEADIVVFQRPSDEKYLLLAEMLKQKGKKIIFENDDTYQGIPLERLENERQVAIARRQNINLGKFLKLADGAIASTDVLAEEFKKLNKNVVVLKNCIDPSDEFPCKKNTTGKFRIGFIGSVTTNDDYIHIKEDIKRLDERGDCTIVVMGIKYRDGTHLPILNEDHDFWNALKNVEWHTYVPVTEYMMKVADLALDVAIIPRKEHYFNECKSNLKFLEMSLLKIPVVAQGFTNGKSPYQGQDEKYMTVIQDGWYETILNVKENYEKYKALAEKAHDYVLRHYNITTYANTWVKTIKKLCK